MRSDDIVERKETSRIVKSILRLVGRCQHYFNFRGELYQRINLSIKKIYGIIITLLRVSQIFKKLIIQFKINLKKNTVLRNVIQIVSYKKCLLSTMVNTFYFKLKKIFI